MTDTQLIVLTVIATVLVLAGLYRLRERWHKVEPKAWAVVVREALQAMEKEALEREHEAAAMAADAAQMRAQLQQLRGQISGPAA